MNFYDWGEIKMRVSVEDYLNRQGTPVREHRCAATWRGGTHQSVSIDGDKWCDHGPYKECTSTGAANKAGGSVIDLCAIVQFNGDLNAAASWLGDNFNLTPKLKTRAPTKKSKADLLIEDGYTQVARYDYVDESGTLVYMILRFEKMLDDGTKDKTFIHATPNHEKLDADTQKLIYNLPAVIASQEVYIVEGEKDVDTLKSYGITATCNSGGACNWNPGCNHWLAGKDVVILADNDEKGTEHADTLAGALKSVAASVKKLTVSKLPKGDVTDWIEKEGGTPQLLRELVAKTSLVTDVKSPELALAKQANQTPFCNYTTVRVGKTDKQVPIRLDDLIKECHMRTLNYPRMVGTTAFDWQKDTRTILYFTGSDDLFAWLGRTTHQIVDWASGQGYVSQKQFFCGLCQAAIKYESVSSAPHYPPRKDVYYTHGKLPVADPTHDSFWRLVDWFNPCNEVNRTALAAFLAAPMFYSPGCDRPMWVIDTIDQQGSGKSALVQMCALLYDCKPMPCDLNLLEKDAQQFRRRLVTSSARSSRIVTIDNLVGTAASPNLAALITESQISAIAPYGHHEESRPNDITYCITVNNAEMNTDLASRSYTVRLARPKNPAPDWKEQVIAFINAHRYQIYSDILDMFQHNQLHNLQRRRSRFGGFDKMVLTAVCRNEQEFKALDDALTQENEKANRDESLGADFLDLFMDTVAKGQDTSKSTQLMSMDELQMRIDYAKPIFMRAQDIDWMLKHSDGALQRMSFSDAQGLVRNGLVKQFDRRADRVPCSAKTFAGTPMTRFRGLVFIPDGIYSPTIEVQVISKHAKGDKFSVLGIVQMRNSSARNDAIDINQIQVQTTPAAKTETTADNLADDIVDGIAF